MSVGKPGMNGTEFGRVPPTPYPEELYVRLIDDLEVVDIAAGMHFPSKHSPADNICSLTWEEIGGLLKGQCIQRKIASVDTSPTELAMALSQASTDLIGGALLELKRRPRVKQKLLARMREHAPYDVPSRKLTLAFEKIGLEWLLDASNLRQQAFKLLSQQESAATAGTVRRRGR